MLNTLKWELNPPTSNMWANRLAKQWDDYLESRTDEVNSCEVIAENVNNVKFKQTDLQVKANSILF